MEKCEEGMSRRGFIGFLGLLAGSVGTGISKTTDEITSVANGIENAVDLDLEDCRDKKESSVIEENDSDETFDTEKKDEQWFYLNYLAKNNISTITQRQAIDETIKNGICMEDW